MQTATLKVVVPAGLSPALNRVEQRLAERFQELERREREGRLLPEQLAAARQATAVFEKAAADFGPVVAAYHGRAAMYGIPADGRAVAMLEQDIRDELSGLEVLFQQVQRASDEDRDEIEGEQILANERLALRRKLLEEVKQRRENHVQMLDKAIATSFAKDIAVYEAAMRAYLAALDGVAQVAVA